MYRAVTAIRKAATIGRAAIPAPRGAAAIQAAAIPEEATRAAGAIQAAAVRRNDECGGYSFYAETTASWSL